MPTPEDRINRQLRARGMKGFRKFILMALAFVGCVTLLSALGLVWYVKNQTNESMGIRVPLEKDWDGFRHLREGNDINSEPFKRSRDVSVYSVRVLDETPRSAKLEIQYSILNGATLKDVWVSATVADDNGWPVISYFMPSRVAESGTKNTAVIIFGIAETTKEDIYLSNSILINFYESGGPIFHEEKFMYSRVWCRKESEITLAFELFLPSDQESRFAFNGARSVSRLCLKSGASLYGSVSRK